MKRNYTGALLALFAAGSFAITPAAFAVTTYDIQPGQNQPITLSADQQVLLHVPDSNGLRLTFPELSNSESLPPSQQDTFFVDASTFQTRELKYTFVDPSGQTQASGVIINTNVVTGVNTSSLESIEHYSTAYTYDKKPEPQYYNTSVAQAETQETPTENVRGYW